jgi:hypothetical protein
MRKNKMNRYSIAFLFFALMSLPFANSMAENSEGFIKRPFQLKNNTHDLVVESTTLSLLEENSVQLEKQRPDLSIGFFTGPAAISNQSVKMGNTLTNYNFDNFVSIGVDAKKDIYSPHTGLGFQLEYLTYQNNQSALHILPATLYGFLRSSNFTQLKITGIVELGYTSAYIRQVGTVGRTGGLSGNATFWQAGFEVPVSPSKEMWSVGLFYSERIDAQSDFNLTGETIKLQGTVTL